MTDGDDPDVTGPPAAMADADDLTPMLAQYVECCRRHDDALLIFRVGDFYKSFCETAREVARVCELTLTEREDSTGTFAMAGIPVDSAAGYVESLLDAGYRVAIADQVEDPEAASGLVDRAVTRVVTPGTVVDDELLAPDARYVASVARERHDAERRERSRSGAAATDDDSRHALAAVDVSTGECLATSVSDAATLRDELARLGPAEVLVGPDAADPTPRLEADPMVTDVDDGTFDCRAARETLARYVADPDAVLDNDTERRAAGAVLAYAEYTQGDDGPLGHVSRISRYDPRDSLRLDPAARRSLELFESRGVGSGTPLAETIDETSAALGRRTLAAWLRRPLVDEGRIERRHDAVAALREATVARDALADRLRETYDLERLAGRISRERADARDLRALASTLAVVPDLCDALDGLPALGALRDDLDPLDDVRERVDAAIVDDPPAEVTEGGVVREGYDEDLDALRQTAREGREWVADLEARERERTGIDSLKVGHTQVHGYYIEVTEANLDRVPDDYVRRQTLKNAERYYTPELKRREEEIFGATERADAAEYEIFCEVRAAIAAETDRIQALADALGRLDALVSFATVAAERDYCRPAVGADGFDVRAGRHPTVERTTEFVPNDTALDRGTVAVITGPNMSGKSTYMRQVALHVVLAQAGSFVPADEASLPVVDRVFTRVGASDDIAGGQSTFMREMTELTAILHGATEESLVLLDEVGRGTATTDGRAIARAAVEFLHDEVGATTLFATHYHDLTTLAEDRERVRNLHFRATNDGSEGDVTVLHRVAPGAASSSYGVQVARAAGVPTPVVERARALVAARTEQTAADDSPAATTADPQTAARSSRTDGGARARVADRIASMDLATTTPLEALTALHDLQRALDDGGR
ncbi:MAG: DNA mismatch repair protein MutS [Haloferacaceae archaeon]